MQQCIKKEKETKDMKVRDSGIIKGLAVMLLFFYHLFLDQDRNRQFGLTGYIGSDSITNIIVEACHICVCLFVFVTAYGITMKEKESQISVKEYFAKSLGRYLKLLSKFAYVFLAVLMLSYVFNMPHNASTAWGAELQFNRILGIICNTLGLADIFNVPWFNDSWWYLSLEVLLIFLIPVWHVVIKKIGPALAVFLSFFVIPSMGLDTSSDGLPRYFMVVTLGIVFAEYSVFERVNQYVIKRKGMRAFAGIVFLLSIPVIIRLGMYTESKYLAETILMLPVIGITMLFIRRIPVLSSVLAFLGKYSLYMWMLHSFFTSYWFQSYLYSLQNIWLIYITLMAVTLAASVLISKTRNLFRYDKIKGLYNSNGGLLFLSIITVIVCFAVTAVSSPMAYLTNDDGGIQSVLSGSVTGSPYVTHQFINVILGAMISSLYKIAPSIQWWYVYSQLLTALGAVFIHFSILKISRKKEFALGVPMFVIGIIDTVFFIYPIANVAFTIVPAILGTGLVSLLFLRDDINWVKWGKKIGAVVVIGYILALIHRRSSAFALLCFILMAVLYGLVSRAEFKVNKKLAVSFAAISIFFCVITAGIVGFDSKMNEKINGEDFVEYNLARSDYMDYPHDTYWENEALFNSVGWDENTYSLVSDWCFIDENVNTENFRYISEHSDAVKTDRKELVISILQDTRCQAIILVWGFSVLLALYVLIVGFKPQYGIFLCLNNLGSVILLLYQWYQGRMMFRSIFVVLFPAFVINVILMLKNYTLNKRETHLFKLAVFCISLFCSSVVLDYVFDPVRNAYKEASMVRGEEIEEYAVSNPENVYIHSVGIYDNIDPWMTYDGVSPTNLIPWGGSAYNSDNYNKRLELNGLPQLSGAVFKEKNVYFMTSENVLATQPAVVRGSLFSCFYNYLKDKFDVKGFVFTDDIDGLAATYQFVFDGREKEFSHYYDIVDSQIVELGGVQSEGKEE